MAITHPSHLHESTIGWPRWWLSNRWYVGWLFSNSAVRGYIHMIRCLHVGKVMFQPEQEAEIELDDDDDDLPIWFTQSVQQLVTVNVSPLIFSDISIILYQHYQPQSEFTILCSVVVLPLGWQQILITDFTLARSGYKVIDFAIILLLVRMI